MFVGCIGGYAFMCCFLSLSALAARPEQPPYYHLAGRGFRGTVSLRFGNVAEGCTQALLEKDTHCRWRPCPGTAWLTPREREDAFCLSRKCLALQVPSGEPSTTSTSRSTTRIDITDRIEKSQYRTCALLFSRGRRGRLTICVSSSPPLTTGEVDSFPKTENEQI